ncbi:cysteine hydrolase (plasmid) [Rhizobium leguminosarum bv. trifolii CB782]|nr:cysteine hydrolase [Rhizobium leguminosarum bv. trifolii CB782]
MEDMMGEIGEWRHLCVDMQRMFAEDTPWHVPWMARVAPQIEELAGRHPSRTIFTRFLPPEHADEMPGKWRDYYRKWWMMTGEHLPRDLVDVASSLASLVPPARRFDKRTYSPWIDGRLHQTLQSERVDTLVITGGETDVCVLATTLGAIDLGYRVIVLKDAVCSSADDTYDASLELLHDRFSVQLELMETEAFLRSFG